MSDRSLKTKLRKKAKKSKRLKIAKNLERDGHHSPLTSVEQRPTVLNG